MVPDLFFSVSAVVLMEAPKRLFESQYVEININLYAMGGTYEIYKKILYLRLIVIVILILVGKVFQLIEDLLDHVHWFLKI